MKKDVYGPRLTTQMTRSTIVIVRFKKAVMVNDPVVVLSVSSFVGVCLKTLCNVDYFFFVVLNLSDVPTRDRAPARPKKREFLSVRIN